jgi:hypothetical protein
MNCPNTKSPRSWGPRCKNPGLQLARHVIQYSPLNGSPVTRTVSDEDQHDLYYCEGCNRHYEHYQVSEKPDAVVYLNNYHHYEIRKKGDDFEIVEYGDLCPEMDEYNYQPKDGKVLVILKQGQRFLVFCKGGTSVDSGWTNNLYDTNIECGDDFHHSILGK